MPDPELIRALLESWCVCCRTPRAIFKKSDFRAFLREGRHRSGQETFLIWSDATLEDIAVLVQKCSGSLMFERIEPQLLLQVGFVRQLN